MFQKMAPLAIIDVCVKAKNKGKRIRLALILVGLGGVRGTENLGRGCEVYRNMS